MARAAKHIPIAQLEIATLAFVICAIIIYLLVHPAGNHGIRRNQPQSTNSWTYTAPLRTQPAGFGWLLWV